MLKRIYSINFFDSFIFGITTVAVPLLMLERGIDVATIGAAFALAPLAKAFVRLISAMVADTSGERVFYYLSGAGNFFQSLAYGLASTPAGYALGRAIDGARDSFIWAVNRTSVLSAAPGRKHYAVTGMVSGRMLYFAAGSLAFGILYPLGGFGLGFALCALLGIVILFLSRGVKNTHERRGGELPKIRFFGRERAFYETIGAMITGGAMYAPVIYLFMPIYFSNAGFSVGEIGIFYAAYFLIFGLAMNAISHARPKAGFYAPAGGAIFAISLFTLAFFPSEFALCAFLFMALGDACLGTLWEEVICLQAKGAKDRSTEISLLHLPVNVATAAAAVATGLVAASYGYAPVFAFAAACLVAFAAWGLRLSGIRR